ncbi:MAG: M28 family peptidase [Bacteroidetes bacterium]|nr:MAG: M28 family peptidase [Bacteroidota bacterium]
MSWAVGLLMLAFSALPAQNCATFSEETVERLKADVYYLASDELEGREAGTEGEQMALAFISERFAELGLKPMGEGGTFVQPFPFHVPVRIDMSTQLELGGEPLEIQEDFYPVAYSANGSLKNRELAPVGFGIEAPELDYSDYEAGQSYEGKILVINYSSPDGVHPHSKYLAYHDLEKRLEIAAGKGAAGVILFNTDRNLPDPDPNFTRILGRQLPVLFLRAHKAHLLEEYGAVDLLAVQMEEQTRTGHNVAGLLDREAKETIIIGAHYDHLGWGGEGSRYLDGPAIHNGADDNASGVAAMLEVARYFASGEAFSSHNLLFLAFSAEEKGLLGSKYFTRQSPIKFKTVNYMLNMDMVGRLNESKELVVNGVGTSPTWERILPALDCYDLQLKTTRSGIGPSDHTSFYLQDVPVLHFFTGTHEDYHRPEDDADKVNYEGLAEVTAYLETLIQSLDSEEKLAFTATADEQPTGGRRRFSVTLGVMPDYTFEGGGMRLDAVTEGKPAQAAGLQGGDIITQMGEVPIKDMMSYMQALGMFKKGDKVMVTYLREGKEEQVEVTF